MHANSRHRQGNIGIISLAKLLSALAQRVVAIVATQAIDIRVPTTA